jgi:hypothetical protein
VGVPGVVTGKAAGGMRDQASDHMGGQGAFTHVGERRGVDDVIVVAGAQQREKVEAALGAGQPGEVGVADLRAEAIRGFVAGAGVVDRDPYRRSWRLWRRVDTRGNSVETPICYLNRALSLPQSQKFTC